MHQPMCWSCAPGCRVFALVLLRNACSVSQWSSEAAELCWPQRCILVVERYKHGSNATEIVGMPACSVSHSVAVAGLDLSAADVAADVVLYWAYCSGTGVLQLWARGNGNAREDRHD